MIYFITNESNHLSYYRENLPDNIEVLEDNPQTYLDFIEYFEDIDLIGFDVESNGLDAWKNNTLLYIIGDKDNQYVFHSVHSNFKHYYKWLYDSNKLLIGHNIKFDIKFGFTECNILYKRVYDTMIAEQRIFMKSKLFFSLENLAIRYLDVYPDAMDKSIRTEFIGANAKSFKVEPKHIYYAASDVEHLFPIKEKQVDYIEKYKLQFLIYDIEFLLIHIIAKAELTGFRFDKDKWLEVYNDNLLQKFELEKKLDEEIRRLRDEVYFPADNDTHNENRMRIVGGKWDNERRKTDIDLIFNDNGTTNVLDLFGEPMSSRTYTGLKKKIVKAPNNVNYSSESQIIEIFAIFKEPLPTKQKSLVVPKFNRKQKIDKTTYNFKTGEPALNEYLADLPNSSMKLFIQLLVEYRGYATACNNFGSNFIDKINPITGKLHTIFRQANAETGRFQSGGGNREPDKPNFQNIPSKAKYAIKMRNCFMADEGYSIVTADLGGAELIIMCSLSQDMKLLEISKGDMHSYVAQGSYRLIYNYRARKAIATHTKYRETETVDPEYDKEEVSRINKLINLSKTFIVNKKDKFLNKIRTAWKPQTFGTIYGMFAAKASKSLTSELAKAGVNDVITKEEGQIVINFIKKEFPDVIRMVEEASTFARNYGYLVLNTRTNSRAWFPNIINLLKGKISEKDAWKLVSKEMSEARNIKIQGTQADMIKEATVELQKWIDNNHLTNEITILSWVHDEIVTQCPKSLDGKSKEWREWRTKDNELYYNSKSYSNFPDVKAQIMIDTCNKYLHNVTMSVDYDVEPYWTK